MRSTGSVLRGVLARLRDAIEDALAEEHTPRQVAASFALGVFITALPTLGIGVVAFFVIAYLFASVSKIALFASVLVLNPVVKWGVYAASYWLGALMLGPAGVTVTTVSPSAAPEIVLRLLVGNLLLAVVFTLVGYLVAYRLTVEYRRRRDDVGVVEAALEEVVELLPED